MGDLEKKKREVLSFDEDFSILCQIYQSQQCKLRNASPPGDEAAPVIMRGVCMVVDISSI